MKKHLLFFTIFALGFVISCTKDSDKEGFQENEQIEQKELDSDKEDLQENEKIELIYRELKITADSILLSDNPIDGFIEMADEYRKIPEVKTVELNDNGMFIEFTNSHIVGWYIPSEIDSQDIPLSYANNLLDTYASSPTSTEIKNVCILNQQVHFSVDGEKKVISNNKLTVDLTDLFGNMGWNVVNRIGPQVNLDFIGNQLKNYDIVFYIAHGMASLGRTWISTGQIVDSNSNLEASIAYITSKIEIDGIMKTTTEYAFCADFINNNYNLGDFKNALIYMVACQNFGSESIGNNKTMAEAFVDRGGADLYIGWYESNYSGQEAGYQIMNGLVNGKTIKEIKQILKEYKWSDRIFYPIANLKDYDDLTIDYETSKKPTSTLKFYPEAMDNYRLVDLPTPTPSVDQWWNLREYRGVITYSINDAHIGNGFGVLLNDKGNDFQDYYDRPSNIWSDGINGRNYEHESHGWSGWSAEPTPDAEYFITKYTGTVNAQGYISGTYTFTRWENSKREKIILIATGKFEMWKIEKPEN